MYAVQEIIHLYAKCTSAVVVFLFVTCYKICWELCAFWNTCFLNVNFDIHQPFHCIFLKHVTLFWWLQNAVYFKHQGCISVEHCFLQVHSFWKLCFHLSVFFPCENDKDCLRKEDKAHTLIFVDKCRPVMSSSTWSKTIDNWSYLYSRHRIRTHLTTRLDT